MVCRVFNKNIKNGELEKVMAIIDGFFDKKFTKNVIFVCNED